MAVDTRTRYIFDAHGVKSPFGAVGGAAVYHDSQWDFEGPRVIYFHTLTYVLEGRCRFTEPSGRDEVYEAGDLFFCFPGLPHRLDPMPDEQFSEFWLTMNGSIFDLWRSSGFIDPQTARMHLEPVEYWLGRFEALFANMRPDEYGQTMLIGALQSLIAEAMSVQPEKWDDTDEEWLAHVKSRLDAVTRANELDLPAIAAELGMSYAHFRRKFFTLSGMPPGRYHTRVIMHRICEWLHTSKAANKEIAEWYGFCNEHHFSKRFKEIVGMSPREFRSMSKGHNNSIPNPR